MTKDYTDFLQTLPDLPEGDYAQDNRDEFAGNPEYAEYYEEWC